MIVNNDINSMYAGLIYAPYIPKMSLILKEERIHGVKYHTVKPIFANWKVLEEWGIQTYGDPSDIWDTNCGRWYMNDAKFWFRNESDLTLFILRWS